MKIIFLLAFPVYLLPAYDLFAQHANAGLKGGFNTSKLSVDLGVLTSNYHLGVYGQYDLNRRFTIQGEMNYLSKKNTDEEEHLVQEELQFPILLKCEIYKPLYIQLGFQYNAIVSVKKGDLSILGSNLPNYYSTFIGTGIDLPSGFEFSTRYYFFNIVEQSKSSPMEANVIQVSIGFDIY